MYNEFQPMQTAPRDGTIIRLLVQFEDHPLEDDNTKPLWTIGGNSFDNTGEDLWQFAGWCWTHDRFTDGVGTPVGWLPLIDTPAHSDHDALLASLTALLNDPAVIAAARPADIGRALCAVNGI